MKKIDQVEAAAYELSSPFLLDTQGTRLIEIQCTRECNLRCIHCYSESNTYDNTELSLQRLKGFLSEASHMGYRYVGVSGGEPLLWGDLENFLKFSIAEGYSTSVATNGTLLTRNRAERLRGLAGIVAVSVDGPPEDHAIMRRSATAFTRMQAGLAALRDANVPFSLSFTLTRFNADRLSWLYNFAHDEGAVGINVHPLCSLGAASRNLADAIPDSLEFKISSYLLALLMKNHGTEGPAVTLDVTKKTIIDQTTWPLLNHSSDKLNEVPFSEIVPSLVVEEDGGIVPFIYGFPRVWSLGFIDVDRLSQAAEKWLEAYAPAVQGLLHYTLNRLDESEVELFDLFGEMLKSTRE